MAIDFKWSIFLNSPKFFWRKETPTFKAIFLFFSVSIFVSTFELLAKAEAEAEAEGKNTGHSKEGLFSVKSVTGNVFFWKGDSVSWEKVSKNQIFRRGNLLQIGDSSSLSLEVKGEQDSFGMIPKIGTRLSNDSLVSSAGENNEDYRGVSAQGGDSLLLTIKHPMVLRLDENLVRRLTLDAYFLGDFPKLEPPQDKQSSFRDNIALTMNDAWRKLAAVFPRLAEKDVEKIPQGYDPSDREDTSIALRAKRIRILSPKPDALLQASGFPTYHKLVWQEVPKEKSAKKTEYYIYAWSSKTARPGPYAKTDGDFFTIAFDIPGNYFVQVTTTDGVWQSLIHPIYVASPDILSFSESQKTTQKAGEERPTIDLVYPAHGFILVKDSKEKLKQLHLKWVLPKSLSSIHSMTNIVINSKYDQKLVLRKDVSQTSTTISLPDGEYEWHVEKPTIFDMEGSAKKYNKLSPILLAKSKARYFKIVTLKSSSRILEDILSEKGASSHVIYFEDGF